VITLLDRHATRILNFSIVLVTLALGASLFLSSIPSAHAVGPWALNVKTVMNDGVTDLVGAKVTMTNTTAPFELTVTCGSYGCWANYTSITDTEVVTVKVQWQTSWVNGSFSVTMDADKDVTAVCKVYSITPVWKDNTGAALYVEPTAFTWTPPNSTLSGTLTPGVAYSIQNGTTTLNSVTWEGSNVIPAAAYTFDPSSGSPSFNLEVYSVTLLWKTNAGVALNVEPNSFKWTPANTTLSGVLTPGAAYYLQNGTTTVSAVTWEGTDVTPVANTFDANVGATFNLKVYSVTPLWKDNTGAALYIEPASFQWTPPNGTLSAALTPAVAYQMQVGTTTLNDVTWEGSNVIPAAAYTFDASTGSPTFSLEVYSVTLLWKTSAGAALITEPTSFKWTPPNTTLSGALTPGTAYYLQNGTTTISEVTWYTTDVTPAANTFDANVGAAFSLKVYSITPTWKTNLGAALIANPASFKWTSPNGTLTGALSPATAYQVANGTVTISAVTWYGTDVTPASVTFVPSDGSPDFNLKVYSITPVWKTSAGAALITEPTSYKMTLANTTLTGALSAGVAYQVANGTITLSAVTWYTTDVTPTAATFIPSDGSPTKNLKVYSITPVWKTSAGAALIANPTSFKWTSPNTTLTGALSPATAYQVANGTVTLSAVTWYGTDVTPASATFIPSDGSPTKNLKVYSITPLWKTNTGVALYTEPTSFKWTPANTTLSGALTPGVAYQVQNGTVTISAVTWEGSNVTPSSGMTFVPSSGSPTKNLNVYSITPLWRDSLGTSPVSVTSFKWTPANTTLSGTFLEATAYWLQNGTTTVSVVMHGGQDITPTSPTFDASSGSPTFTTTFVTGTGGGGLPPITPTTTATQGIQLTLHTTPDYSLSLLGPSATVSAQVALSNSGTSGRNMNVHYLVTNTGTGEVVYENSFDTTVPQGGQSLTFTVPITEAGTYLILIEARNLSTGIVTTTSQQLTVPFMDVWQGPMIIWGTIAGVGAAVILAIVFARDQMMMAIERLHP